MKQLVKALMILSVATVITFTLSMCNDNNRPSNTVKAEELKTPIGYDDIAIIDHYHCGIHYKLFVTYSSSSRTSSAISVVNITKDSLEIANLKSYNYEDCSYNSTIILDTIRTVH